MESPNKWGEITPKDKNKDLKNAEKPARSFSAETVIVFLIAAVVVVFGGMLGTTTFCALLFAATAAALIGLPSRHFGAITAAACLYAAAAAFGGILAGVISLSMTGIMVGDAVAVRK